MRHGNVRSKCWNGFFVLWPMTVLSFPFFCSFRLTRAIRFVVNRQLKNRCRALVSIAERARQYLCAFAWPRPDYTNSSNRRSGARNFWLDPVTKQKINEMTSVLFQEGKMDLFQFRTLKNCSMFCSKNRPQSHKFGWPGELTLWPGIFTSSNIRRFFILTSYSHDRYSRSVLTTFPFSPPNESKIKMHGLQQQQQQENRSEKRRLKKRKKIPKSNLLLDGSSIIGFAGWATFFHWHRFVGVHINGRFKRWIAYNGQKPVISWVHRHDEKILFEDINVFGPFRNTFMASLSCTQTGCAEYAAWWTCR